MVSMNDHSPGDLKGHSWVSVEDTRTRELNNFKEKEVGWWIRDDHLDLRKEHHGSKDTTK